MPTQLSRVLHCDAPPLAAIRGALLGLGYRVSKSHCRPGSLKTDASWRVLWRVMRAWVRTHPIKPGSLTESMPGYRILYPRTQHPDDEHENLDEIVFDEALGREKEKGKGEVNYQLNPNAYWGPMARAGRRGMTAQELSKEGNAEKDKRRREERERRKLEGLTRVADNGEEAEGKRRRRQDRRHGIEAAAAASSSVDVSDRRDCGNGVEETPVRTNTTDGAQYGLAGISASDLDRLEEEAVGKLKS
ncbi:hypothetical protein DRE_06496 [Drechslerella stenobrocha 248]|uniref:tRNA (guanine(26)-N(2))-dimethyltransferase n=1 Tax=Drechslerella stenobrocha 248 TaxID=1043628 RepID=W7HXR9_9PEZI|nr:hypothetical protein DRE_06496 [Drechslerella stenobrocha 248]